MKRSVNYLTQDGNTLPDISILIELAEYYEVDIKEIIDGERKSENMNEEAKELMDKVVDYTSKDKEILIKKTQKYSGIASLALLAGMVLAVFDFSNRYQQIIEVLFGTALILIIAIWLLCSGKAAEMKKDKTKTRKYLVVSVAVLIVSIIFILAMVGLIY